MKNRLAAGRSGPPTWIGAGLALGGLAAALALALPLSSRAAAPSPLGRARSGCATQAHAKGFASYVPALRSYDDNIEDSGNAPDFCASELVTNDSVTVTMGIHAHNRTGFSAGDSYTVYLDTDRNVATGGGVGAEYKIVFTGPQALLERWNGTAFDAASALPVALVWLPDYGPVLGFLHSAIGDPAGFDFVLVSANGENGDRAPDTGSWSYSVEPFALKVKSLSVGAARAGKTFTARAVVLRSDFNEPLDQGKIGCAARLARRSLPGSGKFAGGRAVCTWRMPRSARRKRLSGTLSVTYQGARAARRFSARVR
jgi:hypothetical protein